MARIKKLSVVIPAYNEEQTIRSVIQSLLRELAKLKLDHEVIIVNDGSTDNTQAEINSFKGQLKIFNNPYNRGYGASLKTGIRAANGDYILLMDSDGQHKATDIKKLIEQSDFDMVVGARKKEFSPRGVGKKVLTVLANYLSGIKIPDLNSGFRLIKAEVVRNFLHILPNGFSFSTTITLACLNAGNTVKYVPIDVLPREKGKSKISFFMDGFNFMLLLFRISMLFNPLKIFIPAAGVLLLIGLVNLVYGLVSQFNISDTALLTLISSLVIFLFGLLADQLAIIGRRK